MCAHTILYVRDSARARQFLYTSIYILYTILYVSSYYYICVLILLYVSSQYYMYYVGVSSYCYIRATYGGFLWKTLSASASVHILCVTWYYYIRIHYVSIYYMVDSCARD